MRPIPACAGQPVAHHFVLCAGGAYPRVCGATANRCSALARFAGLSPRVRGNLTLGLCAAPIPGPIPACAGQPAGHLEGRMPGGAYPRVCGATETTPQWPSLPWGLSPRVRGNPETPTRQQPGNGPIPACAGQPLEHFRKVAAVGAYPRVCGATQSSFLPCLSCQGLSPRVRGNRALLLFVPRLLGPIPACAGQPLTQRDITDKAGAYPRVCGATGRLG